MGLLANAIQQDKKNFIKLYKAIAIIADITNDSEDDVVRFFHCTSTPIYEQWLEEIELFHENGYGGYYPDGEFLIAVEFCNNIKDYHTLCESKYFRSIYVEKAKFFSKNLIDILGVSFDIKDFEAPEAISSFEIENPVERRMEENRRKYIAVNDFVNRLSKAGSFGEGCPLRITVEEILENTSLNNISLYKLRGTKYLLVSQADKFKYKNTAEILRSFYDILDDDQMGTVESDRKLFEGFYFKYSEVAYLINSDHKAVKREDTKVRTNKEVSASQPKYNDEVSDQIIEKLKKMTADYEDLSLKHDELERQNKGLFDEIDQYKQDNSHELKQHWEAENKKYKSKIEELETVIKEFSDIEILSQDGDGQLYNWKAMDGNQYPPELHLAIEIWKEYYRAEDTGDIAQFNTARFNRIAIEMNLNEGNLKKRIRSILTPLTSKKGAPDLLAALRGIDIIYNDKMVD